MNYTQLKSLYRVSEISLRYNFKIPYKDRILINSSAIAYEVLKFAWDHNKIELLEQFKILLVDNANKCQGVVDIASGSINSCIVDTRLLFAAALKAKASGIILSHNHPTGNLTPSEGDKQLTNRIWQGGKILDIAILDHLIVSPHGYYSFADEAMLPSTAISDPLKGKDTNLPSMKPK